MGTAKRAEPPAATPKAHRRGTHRLVAPEATVRRALARAGEAGITRVADITGLDHVGVPTVAAYRPNARSLVVSQGKGLDRTAARASALMEALESHAAEHAQLPLRLASYEELQARAAVIDVERLPRVAVGGFHPRRRILWCEAAVLGGEPRFVPYELVHTDFRLPLPTGSGCFMMSSNGLASGNHRLEAISHGLCELVERDALALWEVAGGSASREGRLDLGTVDDEACASVLQRFSAADLAVGVWDITSDVGLPTYACLLADRTQNAFGQTYRSHGSGCHPAPEIALLRALTEAAQTRLTYIAGARDDGDREFFDRARAPSRVEAVRARLLAEAGATTAFASRESLAGDTFEDDLALERARLAAVGLEEVAVVDLSPPGDELPVVRVLIPGLEGLHDAPGYVPGTRARARLERPAP